MIENITLESLIAKLEPISSLPEVVERLKKELKNPYATTEDVDQIIKNDPNLTALLLRIANSSFYGFPKKVETASQAIRMIGIEQIRVLMLGVSVVDYFKNLDGFNCLDLRSFWEHSVATGIACKKIASIRKDHNSEIYFVMGLIHAIGRMILLVQIPDTMNHIIKKSREKRISLSLAESEIMGFNNVELAAEILSKWRYPQKIIKAIKYQYYPSNAGDCSIEATTLHIANIIVHAAEIGDIGESYQVPSLDNFIWGSLNIVKTKIPLILEELDKEIHKTMGLFF